MRRLVIYLLLLAAPGPASADGPADEKPTRREHEVLRERPSGFWTSNKPAEGGSYRWRLLAIGGGLLAITGFGVSRLVKRANEERKHPPRRPWDNKPDEPTDC